MKPRAEPPSTSEHDAPAPARKRVRLSPAVRRQQILDAALVEFSTLGFADASLSKIARRAGTSKANLYVHFSSKDDIFETLLKDLLIPSQGDWIAPQPGQTLDDMIDAFIDNSYASLTPQVVTIIRLIIAEGHRIPDLIQRWHAQTVLPEQAARQQRIRQYVAQGLMRDTPLTQDFRIVMAPLLYAAVTCMLGETFAREEYTSIRETHRALLRMLLRPDATPHSTTEDPPDDPR